MDKARLARLALIPIVLAVLLYPFIPRDRGEEAADTRIQDILQEAVLHYNTSTRMLAAAEEPQDLDSILERLANLSTTLTRFHASNTPGGGLYMQIASSTQAYKGLAEASKHFYEASYMYSKVLDNITRILQELKACNIGPALELWSSIEGNVTATLEAVEAGLRIASRVEPSMLLSEDHRTVYGEGLIRAYGVKADLENLEQLMALMEKYRDVVEDLCKGQPPQGDLRGFINDAGNLLSRVGSSNGGSLSYDMYSTLSRLAGMGSGAGGPSQGGPGGSSYGWAGGGSSSQPGQGAGYGAPPSDD